jgi:beta-phosphoglucomutase family hydrolase
MDFGVIFDMDGVIMDSNTYHEKAWAEFCRLYHIELDEEEFHNHVYGRIARDTLEYIFKKDLTREEIDHLVQKKENIYREIYTPQIRPLEGLMDFLNELRNKGVRMALATSAPPDNVTFTFRHIPIRSYFGVVLDGDSVKQGKPDPEIYIQAIYNLKLSPGQCFIFEDSLAGIQAGIAAGARVIGVTTTHRADEMSGVIKAISNFKEISYSGLKNELFNTPQK